MQSLENRRTEAAAQELLNRIAGTLERIEKQQESMQTSLDNISETLDNILANARGTYNP